MENKIKWKAIQRIAGIIALIAIIVFSTTACDNGNGETPSTHTVTYNGNGNTGGTVPTDSNSPYQNGASVSVLGNTGNLIKTGFTFAGWNVDANGNGASYNAGATFSIYANTTLYAQWTSIGTTTCTVTYNGNENTSGTVPIDPNSPYLNGATVTVLANTGSLAKTGFIFNGWNTAANGSGTLYTAGATFIISTNTVLYAQWTPDNGGDPVGNLSDGWFEAIGSPATAYRIIRHESETPPNQVVIPATYNGLPVTEIGTSAFLGSSITSVNIPNSVTSIGFGAFRSCTGLTSIHIPSSVTSIANTSFYLCSNLASITVDNENPNYTNEGGILYNKTKTSIIATAPKGIIGELIIPNSITNIPSYTFRDCTELTSVTIHSGITSIREGTFFNCTGLISVTIQGIISADNFDSDLSFPGDLRTKYLAGGVGTYTRPNGSSTTWTKQNNVEPAIWTAVANSTFGAINIDAIAWGNNRFVTGVTFEKMAYSSNGTNWTAVTNSGFGFIGVSTICSIAWGGTGANQRFVAVGTNGFMAYSSNGETWTAVTNRPIDSMIKTIAWGNNRFVAGGNNGKIIYSSDGINWIEASNSTFGLDSINDIVWGNNKFVAVGHNMKMAYSTDGITWTSVNTNDFLSFSVGESFGGIAWGNNKFVVGGWGGKAAHSSDGINWTAVENSIFGGLGFGSNSINDITWGNDKFIAVGSNGIMAYSTDGITWTAETNTTFGTSTINGITYGNDKFVAVGNHGKMAYLEN
jgi:uncharacterized repeat protein (TIGR02543 family)